jgi:hypothetical protein
MKKIIILFVLLTTVFSLKAQVIFSDDLGLYSNTALSGQGTWTNNASTWGSGTGTSSTVGTTTLSYPGYGSFSKSTSMASGDSPGFPFSASPYTSGSTVYIAFLVKFSSVTTSATSTYGQFIRLRDASGSSFVPARIQALGLATGTFKFAINKNNAAGDVTTATYALTGTHLVVLKYTVGSGTADDVVRLYVNPTAGAAEPAASATTNTGNDQYTTTNQIQGMTIFNGFNSGSSNVSGNIGGFRVSTTWADLFPACQTPGPIVVSSILPTTATVGWTGSGSNIGGYEYELSTTSTFTGVNTSTVGTSASLTSLTPNTTYYFRVRSNCTGVDGNSSYSNYSFTTAPACIAPTSLTASNLTTTTADLSFTQPGGSVMAPASWEYQLSTSGNSFTTITGSGTISSNPATISGLVPGTFYYVRVRAVCSGSDQSSYAPYTFFSTVTSCYSPISVAATAITGTTATVSWTQPSGSISAPALWDYELSSTGTFTGVATASVTTTFVNLTALLGSSTYYIRVRSYCGVGDNSFWTSPLTFATACNAININSTPYTQDFETTTSGSIPSCWVASTAVSGAPSNSVTASISFPSGMAYAGTKVFKVGYASNAVQRIILPTFDASSLNTVEVSFYASEDNGATTDDNIKVQYSTNGTVWTDVDVVRRYNAALSSSATYSKRVFALPSSAVSATLQIALYCTSVNSSISNNLYIDNLSVGAGTAVENGDANACTSIATNVSNNAAAITGKNFFRYNSASGNVVLEINPNGNSLGSMAVSYKENTAGSANVPQYNTVGSIIVPRYFVIKPTTAPSTAVTVRLYFSDTEFDDYKTKRNSPSSTINDLKVFKYSAGASDDCDPTNNGGVPTVLTTTATDYGNGFYLEFQTSSFSEFGTSIESAVVLPVDLISFKADKSGNHNALTWTTASEKDNSHFILDRSANGRDSWTSIGTIKALGNSTVEKKYSYTDETPLSISYYRLRSVDLTGKEATSKVVAVLRNNGKLVLVSVSPIPTTEGVTIDVVAAKQGRLTATITDIVGKIVQTETLNAVEGTNSYQMDLSNVATGVYLLSIHDGESVITQRVVKQ